MGHSAWHGLPDHVDQTPAHSRDFEVSTPPGDAMRDIRENIAANVRFNAVVHSGVPGFIPKPS